MGKLYHDAWEFMGGPSPRDFCSYKAFKCAVVIQRYAFLEIRSDLKYRLQSL